MDNERKVLTPYEVADALGISVRLVYRQIRNGTIPAIKCGDRYLISKVAFEQWLASGNIPAAASTKS